MRNVLVILILFMLAGCASWEPCAVEIGMTQVEVLQKCGEPQKTLKSRDKHGETELWRYDYYDVWLGYRPDIAQVWYYFHDGKLVRVDE